MRVSSNESIFFLVWPHSTEMRGGCTHGMHDRRRTTIDPRAPTMPGTEHAGFQGV